MELNNHTERSHALLSASSAHRWLECPPSAVAAEAYPSTQTSYTEEGTLAHEVAEAIARQRLTGDTGDIRLPNGVTHEMVDCANGYADYIQEHIKSPDAQVLLETRVDFSPWVPDGFGTCDCIILQDDTMHVIDYKYGQGVVVSAKDNPQLKLYALGALNDYGLAYDVREVVVHIYQPRLNHIDLDLMTTEAVLGWANKTVLPTAEKAAKGKGKHKAGEHCRFCPHAGRCRTLTRTCTEYVETHDLRVGMPVLTDWELADVLKMEPLINLWLRKVKEQAMTRLMHGEPLPGFKLVEGRGGHRTWTDESAVAETLASLGYSERDITKVELLSPAQMGKLIGRKQMESVEQYITRSQGQPVIAPESDPRPAINLADDFENLEG